MMVQSIVLAACLGCVTTVFAQNGPAPPRQDAQFQTRSAPQSTAFKVKYVAQDTVYLSAGRGSGLATGMKLIIKRVKNVSTAETTGEGTGAEIVAELTVLAVTETSSVCNIEKATTAIQKGDYAYFTPEEAEIIAQQQALAPARKFPQVISFSEGDPLEEEMRDAVPRPPLPEVNRLRGRFGVDYGGILTRGPIRNTNTQMGVIFRADITRLWGTYWNVSGYWRGRVNRSSSDQQSIQDLINRTYHLSMTYDNPNSRWVAGFGRLFLPWASSLETIDGGYFGRRFSKNSTAGLFAGSTPDPTSWSYDPDRRLAGGFINFEGGSYETMHYSSTSGTGVYMTHFSVDRPFVFFENNLSYRKLFSFYNSVQLDNPKDSTGARIGIGITRSFATWRFQPTERIEIDVNHNYLRDVPTFDPRLIGTGLLDKYLFQGISFGGRVKLPYDLTVYTTVGRSRRDSDLSPSTNFLYGVSTGQIGRTGLRADARYSQFNSPWGKGHYNSFSVSQILREGLRVEAQVGTQNVLGLTTSQSQSYFFNGNFDCNFGPRYFLQAGFTTERGGTFDYDQWNVTLGYRFDNRTSGARK